ncbi:hypothetical protein [Rhizobium leguminosarum]|uniref:hypothetical protein n=1 Tax=Rhizobium leguminosarum TaxID=384 RepID=UPI0010305E30|nr:hypothetical protein [Rhizobium leguminosarum]TBH09910.1 hypothetical protein ELG68_01370 [Rhizobium leguminosarum]
MANTVPATGEALPNRYLNHHLDALPEVYAMMCEGKCLEPEVMDGSKLMFSRVEVYKPGDLVAIFKKREFTVPGDHQVVVKRLVLAPPQRFWSDQESYAGGNIVPIVIAEMLNPRKLLRFDVDGLLGIHKCLGPVPQGRKTFKAHEKWIRNHARLRNTAAGEIN